MLLVLQVVLLAGCATAQVMHDDLIAPHGERMLELSCAPAAACFVEARRACSGDYDVVTQPSNSVMFVRCVAPAAPKAP
jgi:hypothetical protein